MSDTYSSPHPGLDWMQKQIIENCLSGMMLVDIQQPDMPIIYVNPALEQLTGYSAAEVIGRNARFLRGDDHQQPAIELIRSALEKRENVVATLRNHRKDGSLFWNEVRISYLRDPQGNVTHAVGVLNDVTAHIGIFEHYRQSFESNSAVHLLIDANDGHIVDANSAAAQFYGYPAEQLKSMFIYDINMQGQEAFQRITRQFRSGTGSRLIVQHRLASGAVRDVEVYGSQFETPHGALNHAIVIDVTERLIAERRYQSLLNSRMMRCSFLIWMDGIFRSINGQPTCWDTPPKNCYACPTATV